MRWPCAPGPCASRQTWAMRPGRFSSSIPTIPVVYVSWQDAVAYIAWLMQGDRLARLAAADRGRVGEGRALGRAARTTSRIYPWGDSLRPGPLQHQRERHRDHQPGRLLSRQRRAPLRRKSIRSRGNGGQCVGVGSLVCTSRIHTFRMMVAKIKNQLKIERCVAARGTMSPRARAPRTATTTGGTTATTSLGSAWRCRPGLVHRNVAMGYAGE